ncbi:glycosyltransferase family 4 protein [Ureibacillus sp. GCM10028918]|uniref:glycosyltransferase family 4 protein n=1 Tax=Ureibacillus sp. GCM10028918 TaxID=3273429 RepID=UPI00361A3257
MDIWIFNHYATGPNSSGGTRHYDLARQLVKRGHNVTIFASSFNHQLLKEEKSYEEGTYFLKEISEGVNFVWVKTFTYSRNDYKRVLNMLSYTKSVLRVSKKLDEKPDVVIGSLVHPLAAFAGYMVARDLKCKFVFEERDLWPQTLIDLGKMSNANPIIKVLARIEKFLFKKADLIIVLFDKAVGYVESKGVTKNKILYLPNGYDFRRSENTKELPSDIAAVFKILKNKKIAIYTGAHGLANNLDIILDSAKALKNLETNDVHFILIGNGPEKERLLKRVEDENIKNVTMLNPVKKDFIPTILRKCDIGLLPLVESPVFKWGISPNKMFDYMGSSLPVLLLCNLEGTAIEYSGGGSVIKENFQYGIVKFLKETEISELKSMGYKGLNYVEQNHSWEKLAIKLENELVKL